MIGQLIVRQTIEENRLVRIFWENSIRDPKTLHSALFGQLIHLVVLDWINESVDDCPTNFTDPHKSQIFNQFEIGVR